MKSAISYVVSKKAIKLVFAYPPSIIRRGLNRNRNESPFKENIYAESVYKYKWIILCNTDSQDGRSITLAVRSDAFNYTAASPGVRFSGLTPYTVRVRASVTFFFPRENAVSTPFSSSYRVHVIARCASRYASELSPIVGRENMKFRADNFSISSRFPPPSCAIPRTPDALFRPRPRSRNCEQNALNGPAGGAIENARWPWMRLKRR